jgi:hypothetical protein
VSGPRVTLYTIAHGAAYDIYANNVLADAGTFFFGGDCELLKLPGYPGPKGDNWPYVSARRYKVLLDHLSYAHGDYIFQIDADTRIVGPIGEEILSDGITVTTHPGFPPSSPVDLHPYERRPQSTAYVPIGQGRQYHPGAFVGGSRAAFLALANYVAASVEHDIARGVHAVWYEESHLNRYLLDHPPALVLPREYCWWDRQWGDDPKAMGAKIVHLDKPQEVFDARG